MFMLYMYKVVLYFLALLWVGTPSSIVVEYATAKEDVKPIFLELKHTLSEAKS